MSKKEEEPPKIRLHTIAEFAGLVKASYGTIRQMVLEGAIYENEIVRLRKSVKIKHEAYDRLMNKSGTSRLRRKLTPEEENARHRCGRAYERLQHRLRKKKKTRKE